MFGAVLEYSDAFGKPKIVNSTSMLPEQQYLEDGRTSSKVSHLLTAGRGSSSVVWAGVGRRSAGVGEERWRSSARPSSTAGPSGSGSRGFAASSRTARTAGDLTYDAIDVVVAAYGVSCSGTVTPSGLGVTDHIPRCRGDLLRLARGGFPLLALEAALVRQLAVVRVHALRLALARPLGARPLESWRMAEARAASEPSRTRRSELALAAAARARRPLALAGDDGVELAERRRRDLGALERALDAGLALLFPCRSTGRPDGTPSGSGPRFFLRARASLASRCAAFLATRAFFSARASSRGSTPSAASRSETSMIGASASSPPTLS